MKEVASVAGESIAVMMIYLLHETMIGDLDTKTLYNQLQADLAEFKSGEEAVFSHWSETTQSSMNAWIVAEQADFHAWFMTIQDALGNDAAGNLLNMINAYKAKAHTATLPTSGWSGTGPYTYTASVTDVTADNVVLAGPAPASKAVYEDCGAYPSAQGAGTLTYIAESVPTSTITVNVVVLNP